MAMVMVQKPSFKMKAVKIKACIAQPFCGTLILAASKACRSEKLQRSGFASW